MLLALKSCSHLWDTWYWCFGFSRKAFLSTIFLTIKVHSWNETKLDTRNNRHSFCYGHAIMLPHWDTRSWCLGFASKALLSTIFLIINAHPWKDTKLDTLNILHSFSYGNYNHVRHIGIHDLDALDLEEKLFFSPFSL